MGGGGSLVYDGEFMAKVNIAFAYYMLFVFQDFCDIYFSFWLTAVVNIIAIHIYNLSEEDLKLVSEKGYIIRLGQWKGVPFNTE